MSFKIYSINYEELILLKFTIYSIYYFNYKKTIYYIQN